MEELQRQAQPVEVYPESPIIPGLPLDLQIAFGRCAAQNQDDESVTQPSSESGQRPSDAVPLRDRIQMIDADRTITREAFQQEHSSWLDIFIRDIDSYKEKIDNFITKDTAKLLTPSQKRDLSAYFWIHHQPEKAEWCQQPEEASATFFIKEPRMAVRSATFANEDPNTPTGELIANRQKWLIEEAGMSEDQCRVWKGLATVIRAYIGSKSLAMDALLYIAKHHKGTVLSDLIHLSAARVSDTGLEFYRKEAQSYASRIEDDESDGESDDDSGESDDGSGESDNGSNTSDNGSSESDDGSSESGDGSSESDDGSGESDDGSD